MELNSHYLKIILQILCSPRANNYLKKKIKFQKTTPNSRYVFCCQYQSPLERGRWCVRLKDKHINCKKQFLIYQTPSLDVYTPQLQITLGNLQFSTLKRGILNNHKSYIKPKKCAISKH